MLITFVPHHIGFCLVLFPTTTGRTGEDLRGAVPSHVALVALETDELPIAPGAPELGDTVAVVADSMAGKCGNSAFLMATKVTAHFSDRFSPLPEHFAATIFCMRDCPDTAPKMFFALDADEEPPGKALRAGNLLHQLPLDSQITFFLYLQP